ncbi:MAG TPA: LacI family DNA-binding transcriptional regulator [Armatimonadota bacterium]|jgi:LacI family transcriptional regulator
MQSKYPRHAIEPSVTLAEIAKHCGVGRSTVQRALSGQTNVLPETAARIHAAAAALGYDPAHQEAARRLAYRQQGKLPTNHVIAHVVPANYNDPYYSRISDGIIEVLIREEYALLLVFSTDAQRDRIPPSIAFGHVDGVVLTNIAPQDRLPLCRLLRETPAFRTRPIISLFRPSDSSPAVLVDEQGGAYLATTHLLELGHRRLVEFYGGNIEPDYFSTNRYAGCRRACTDFGLDPHTVLCSPPVNTHQAIDIRYAAPLLQALEQDPTITGILAPNDDAAVHLIYMLRARGYRLPEDYSIVGFDDIRRWDNDRGINQLTTIRVPLEDMGRLAAEQMIACLRGKETPNDYTTLPTQLVVRATTAPPR